MLYFALCIRKRITGNVHDYITLYAVKSYQLLETILEKNEISIQPMSTSYEGNNDKIYIGGPAANVEVNSLLTRFKEFKYYTESHQESTYDKNEINQHFIVYDDNKKGFMFKDRFFKIDKKTNDVGIFIRIPKNEKKGINYTSHIIFAAWDVGTYNAVEFFVNNYKIISKKFKNRPYCFVVPISRIDNSTRLLTENDIEDVSKEFFKGTDILNY